MNIFYLHQEPALAANMLHDKHVVKMILESAQILSSVYHRYGDATVRRYAPTHMSHPSVLWAGDTVAQYQWLFRHALELCAVYRRTWGRTHASEAVIRGLERPPEGLYAAGWAQPPQCMPPEFQVPGDAVAGYRNYYLARKVQQSRWSRRAVPDFVLQGTIMATKSVPAKAAAKAAPAPTKAAAAAAAAPAPAPDTKEAAVPRSRGPRGTTDDSVISILVENPKRPDTKGHAVFSLYENGQTIGQLFDKAEQAGNIDLTYVTPCLAYDSKHGFISIEGYAPPGGVLPPKEPKAPKAKKEPKEPKVKKTKAEAKAEQAAAEEGAEEEVM